MTPLTAALVLDQAAAEYVGVMISSAVRSVGDGMTSFGTWASTHPLHVAGAIAVAVIVWRAFWRR